MNEGSIVALQEKRPQLVSIRDVEIVKTGIEYPLASGPTTFTVSDLASIVGSQEDPGMSSPRIWLGHPDDPRIHGERAPGGPPSGEPAIGRVTNMKLADEGHTVRGDLEGVPLWLASIMASAFPSRSIEANWNVETVTGHKWQLAMSGLALLGVCWPGVSTLEDIAALFTDEGPEGVTIIEATSEEPVTVIEAMKRAVVGQVTVEDVMRSFNENITDLGLATWSWVRAINLQPDELIIDDDEGGLYRVPFSIDASDVSFSPAKKIKIKYVNASNGGVEVEPIPAGKVVVATFDEAQKDRKPKEMVIDLKASRKPKGGEVNVALVAASSTTVQIDLKEKR